jgi:hypothetical protein
VSRDVRLYLDDIAECSASNRAIMRVMEKTTLEQLEAALRSFAADVSVRVEQFATRSSAGTLSERERDEYAEIVRLNDLLGLLRMETEHYRAHRFAS